MTRKNILLTAIVLLLGSLCFYAYKDRFGAPPIQISHRSVPPRGAMLRRTKDSAVDTIIFLLNRELRLTSVKVISLGDLQTNKNPQPIWELISESNSVPVKDIIYGMNIRGMHPRTKGATAGPLEPGAPYRLLITAGSHKAEHDFTPLPRSS